MQQSLFEAAGAAPLVESACWIEGVMLDEIALGVCVIAVAFIGALMLTGHLPLREGARVMVGCFVLLGAPIMAAELLVERNASYDTQAPLSQARFEVSSSRSDLPPASFDPYAGASLQQD